MRALLFTKRCLKEILRDPLTLIFGAGFPVVLLLLLSIMNKNIPAGAVDMFEIQKLLPGIVVFGFSFLSLFGGLLLSTDRETAFLTRLFTSPLRPFDFTVGYALPLLPLGLAQALLCILLGLCFGLELSGRLALMLLLLLPALLLYVSLGLLLGTLLNAKQVGSLCGALLTNLSAWLSGTWFSLDLLGEGFKAFAYCLPFANAVDAARYALSGNLSGAIRPLLIVCGYALASCIAAVLAFRKKMRV